MQIRKKYLPVRSAASAIRKVLYDIKTNRLDSNKGKSQRRVNFVKYTVKKICCII